MSGLAFMTPFAGLAALGAALPIAAALARERRDGAVRGRLGLAHPGRTERVAGTLAAAAAIALLGLAAAQPALSVGRGVAVRSDAQAYAVIDNSRSMLAAATGGPTRLARAKALALRLRDGVPQVPWGVASLSDRTLAHAFPTADRALFADTLAQSVGVGRPGPSSTERTATALDALAQVGLGGFFDRRARKRVVVVFTDGESRPFAVRSLGADLRRAHLRVVIVWLWDARERVLDARGRDLGYRPQPQTRASLRRLAGAGVETVAERRFGTVTPIVERLLGSGPSAASERTTRRYPLAPAIVAAALLPLAFALVRTRR